MCSAGCVFCWNQVDNRNVCWHNYPFTFITENRTITLLNLLISRDIHLFLNFVTEALYININIITIYYKTYIYHIFIYWRQFYFCFSTYIKIMNKYVFYFMRGLFSTVVLWVRIYLPTSEAEWSSSILFYSPHYIEMTHL